MKPRPLRLDLNAVSSHLIAPTAPVVFSPEFPSMRQSTTVYNPVMITGDQISYSGSDDRGDLSHQPCTGYSAVSSLKDRNEPLRLTSQPSHLNISWLFEHMPDARLTNCIAPSVVQTGISRSNWIWNLCKNHIRKRLKETRGRMRQYYYLLSKGSRGERLSIRTVEKLPVLLRMQLFEPQAAPQCPN